MMVYRIYPCSEELFNQLFKKIQRVAKQTQCKIVDISSSPTEKNTKRIGKCTTNKKVYWHTIPIEDSDTDVLIELESITCKKIRSFGFRKEKL